MAFVVVYDACVLFPFHLRDLLLRVAQTGVVQAKWTDRILDEAFDALTEKYPHNAERFKRTRALMTKAIRDVAVTGFEPLIDGIDLPDADDRHVVAAAIRAHAQVIVTDNVRDFPAEVLDAYDIDVQTADVFLRHVFGLGPAAFVEVLEQMVAPMNNPPMSVEEILGIFENQIPETVAAVRAYLAEAET